MEPILRSHKLIIDQGAATRDLHQTAEDRSFSLFHQLTHITRERGCLRHDDRLDCLAHAVAHVQDVAGVNSQEALENARHEEKLKAIDTLLAYSMSFSFDRPGQIPNNYQHKVDFDLQPKKKLFFNRKERN